MSVILKHVGPGTPKPDVLKETVYIEITDKSSLIQIGDWIKDLISDYSGCRLSKNSSALRISADAYMVLNINFLSKGNVSVEYWIRGDKKIGRRIRVNLSRVVKKIIRISENRKSLLLKKSTQEFEFGTLVFGYLMNKFEDIGLPDTSSIKDPDDGKVRRTGTIARRYVSYNLNTDGIYISNHIPFIIIPKCDKNTIANVRENKVYCRFTFLSKRSGRAKVRTGRV